MDASVSVKRSVSGTLLLIVLIITTGAYRHALWVRCGGDVRVSEERWALGRQACCIFVGTYVSYLFSADAEARVGRC